MERLKKRTFWVAAAMLVVGVAVMAVPDKKPAGRTEQWMEQMAPRTVEGYSFIQSKENPEQSRRMDEKSYRLLAPFGIVDRVYRLGSRQFEVVLVASNNRGSFHDPRVCFAGQGWNFDKQNKTSIRTRSHGYITATFIEGKTELGFEQYAVYFYKGPSGFSSSTLGIKGRLLMQLLLNPFGGPGEAVFYRFVSESPEVKKEEFIDFIGKYMDAANESSNGYF
jgi:hypothetical protein